MFNLGIEPQKYIFTYKDLALNILISKEIFQIDQGLSSVLALSQGSENGRLVNLFRIYWALSVMQALCHVPVIQK